MEGKWRSRQAPAPDECVGAGSRRSESAWRCSGSWLSWARACSRRMATRARRARRPQGRRTWPPLSPSGPPPPPHSHRPGHRRRRRPDAADGSEPAHRPARQPGGRPPASDRRHGRRRLSRPAAVGLQLGVDRLARPCRGGRSALHDDLPERDPGRRGAGPERTPVLRRVGVGMARDVRPPRRLAAGDRDAPGQGRRPVGLQRGWLPLARSVPVADPRSNRAAQRVHGRRAAPEAGHPAQRGRRSDHPDLVVRAGRESRPAPVGRHDQRHVPVRDDHLPLRRGIEPLRALHQQVEDAPDRPERRSDRGARERGHPAHGLRAAQRRPSQEAPPGGEGRRDGPGVDLDQWGHRQGHLEEEVARPRPRSCSARAARPSPSRPGRRSCRCSR